MSDLSPSQKHSDSAIPTEQVADTSKVEPISLFDSGHGPSDQAEFRRAESRPFKPRQFLFGLALSAGGMGLMLFVAAGALHDAGAGGAVSLPATGLCMILGLMLLGGGFGQMAISSPRFDDTEFQRMLNGEMLDHDEDSDETGFDLSSDKASSGLIDDSNSDNRPVGGDEDSPNQSEVATSKKREEAETRDGFVSTVISDVVASQG